MPSIKDPTNIARARFLDDMSSKDAIARKKPTQAITMIHPQKVRSLVLFHVDKACQKTQKNFMNLLPSFSSCGEMGTYSINIAYFGLEKTQKSQI